MATRKQPIDENRTTQAEAAPASASLIAPVSLTSHDEQMATQMAELKGLVTSLMATVQETRVRGAQDAEFHNTIAEIKQVARAIPTVAVYPATPHAVPGKDDCDDCGCGCVNSSCCCYEIVLDRIRAIQPQGILEAPDAGEVPLLINQLEVRLFASIDNVGVLIPSLSTTMGLRVPSLLSGGGPGLWMSLDRVIGRVFVKKGTSRTITVDFQGAEIDEGIEAVLGKDEYGSASGSITVDCCSAKIYPPAPTDLSFNFGGIGGGNPGAISMAFHARRVCC